MQGVPAGWYPPGPPDDWKPRPHKVKSDEPEFSPIDNPGNWSEFMYQSTFSGKNRSGKHINHKTPSGEKVLLTNPMTGKREVGGFKLHYNGWKLPEPTPYYCRVGSTRQNFFPEYRASKLDREYLTKQGLTKQRMRDKDAFFS